MSLKQIREKSGYRQLDIAKFLGVTQVTYHRYESGEREPSIEQLKKLSAFFCVSIDSILDNCVEEKDVLSQYERQLIEAARNADKRARTDALMLLKAKPYYVIALVSREYGQLVQISELLKEGKGSGEIAKAVGVPPFAVGRKIGIVKKYSSKGLLRQLDRCQDADLAIKSGRLTVTNAAENVILNLLG